MCAQNDENELEARSRGVFSLSLYYSSERLKMLLSKCT